MQTYEQQVERKRKLIAKHNKELRDMLAICPHERVEEKSRYFSGGYYDKAHTEHWIECLICGERGPVTTKEHSWYG